MFYSWIQLAHKYSVTQQENEHYYAVNICLNNFMRSIFSVFFFFFIDFNRLIVTSFKSIINMNSVQY